MSERSGVTLAVLSSVLGGTAAAVTRYLVAATDPFTLALLRFGIGFACLLPLALVLRVRWPRLVDWPWVAGLGFCFFGLFFALYNLAMSYTTAARASLALATLPLQTMVVGALLGIETLTARKSAGVLLAMLGVALALATNVAQAPRGAWRGEVLMACAVLCMAFYNVWARPFIQRSSALGFLVVGMGVGATALAVISAVSGGAHGLRGLTSDGMLAALYLGVAGGAAAFALWVFALQRASPTRVANTMALNPLAAMLVAAALMGEPITGNVIGGLIAVCGGVALATSDAR